MQNFTTKIIDWYKINLRDLPWRETKNPYKIWLSEIILQQTQVKQGLPYYQKFIAYYPTINHLADSDIQQILTLWQGLGYYSRARNLHDTAKEIVKHYNGIFPDNYDEIIKLKGIGPYTASAICSFAYGQRHAVLDGNVFRVLSRYFNIPEAINSYKGKKYFEELSKTLLPNKKSDYYNQGIMELGALVCTPQKPDCKNCPVNKNCIAFIKKNPLNYPVKINKRKIKNRYFTYVCVDDGQSTILIKRKLKDIWLDLYEFPMLESESLLTKKDVQHFFKTILNQNSICLDVIDEKHQLTHQLIHARLYYFQSDRIKNKSKINWDQIEKYPIPRLIEKFIFKIKE